MDENKGQVQTEPSQEPVLTITVDHVSSKAVEDPLQVGFTFIIKGHVYRVYEVRPRGRKFVKFMGMAKAVSHG
jgi:hypothetical protein